MILYIQGLSFVISWIEVAQSHGQGVCRTARKAEQLQNSLLQIEGLQVGGP